MQIENRTEWNDAGWVNLAMSHVIMTLYMIQVDRIRNAGLLKKVAQIALEIRVIHNSAQVTFEVPVVNGIEADQGTEQAPIGFDNTPAK